MGVRFACHICGKQLNIKQELAGRRGVCPKCQAKFRIPLADAPTSVPIQDTPPEPGPSTPEAEATGASESVGSRVPEAVGRTKPTAVVPASPKAAEPGPANAEIDLIADDPDAAWYIRPPSGGQYGPASGDLLRQWIAEGRVAATALIWRDGWPQWRVADEALAQVGSSLPQPIRSPTPDPSRSAGTGPATASSGSSIPTQSESLAMSGQSDIGAARRSRSLKRMLWIGILSLVAISLAGVLFFLLNRPDA